MEDNATSDFGHYHEDVPHTAEQCKGGAGWLRTDPEEDRGVPWDLCPIHWPTESVDRGSFRGPRTEFVSLTHQEAEALFPGFFDR